MHRAGPELPCPSDGGLDDVQQAQATTSTRTGARSSPVPGADGPGLSWPRPTGRSWWQPTGRSSSRPAVRSWSRRGVVTAGGVVAVALSVLALAAAAQAGGLPAEVAGLPRVTDRDADVDRAVAAVVQRLESEPAVDRVAVGRYGDDGGSLVVMLVAPRSPLGEEAAGELTARAMDAVLPAGDGSGRQLSSVVSRDGAALLTCTTRRPGAATCLTVDPDHAVLMLSSGVPGDATALAEVVRADVLDLPHP